MDAQQDQFLAEMEGEQMVFSRNMREVETKVTAFSKFVDLSAVERVADDARAIDAILFELNQKSNEFRSRSILFGIEMNEAVTDDLQKAIKTFEPFKALWVTADVWIKKKQEYLHGIFTVIDDDDLEAVVAESFKTMTKQARFFQAQKVDGCAAARVARRRRSNGFKADDASGGENPVPPTYSGTRATRVCRGNRPTSSCKVC